MREFFLLRPEELQLFLGGFDVLTGSAGHIGETGRGESFPAEQFLDLIGILFHADQSDIGGDLVLAYLEQFCLIRDLIDLGGHFRKIRFRRQDAGEQRSAFRSRTLDGNVKVFPRRQGFDESVLPAFLCGDPLDPVLIGVDHSGVFDAFFQSVVTEELVLADDLVGREQPAFCRRVFLQDSDGSLNGGLLSLVLRQISVLFLDAGCQRRLRELFLVRFEDLDTAESLEFIQQRIFL